MKKIDLNRQGLPSMFGALESDILTFLWKNKKGCSREIYNSLKNKHKCAHCTISVTLDRLHEKGLVERKEQNCRGGTKYIYSPKLSKEELGNKVADKFLKFLKGTFGDACVASLKTKIR